MNAVNFTPNISESIVSTGTTGTTAITNDFSKIVQQLMNPEITDTSTMFNGIDENIKQILLNLFGSGEETVNTDVSQLLLQMFGGTEDLESITDNDLDLNAMLISAGIMPTQTAQINSEGVNVLEQMLTQSSESSGVYALMQVISQMSGSDQKNMFLNLMNNPTTTSATNSTQEAVTSVASQLFPLTSNANPTTSSVTGENVQQLVNLLGGATFSTQQSSTLESFTDTLTRMQITNAIQPTIETGEAGEETINLEQLQQSLLVGNDSTANSNSVFGIPTNSETQSTAAKAQDIALQLNQGMQNLTQTNEFTVKLSPEGLGDITVSLTQTAGKMSLVLTATSAETARLLNSEMATLQSTLRTTQSEAEPIIVVQTSQSETGNDYLFNGFSQQEHKAKEQFIVETNFSDGEEILESEEQEIVSQVVNSLLSTRV